MKNCICHIGFKGARTLAGRITMLLLLAGAVLWLGRPLAAAERRWTGNASGLWSNPNNWDPAGSPQNGDRLVFEQNSNTSMVNDLVDLSVTSMEFVSHDYRLSGNALTLSSSTRALLDIHCMDEMLISCPLILRGEVDIDSGCLPDRTRLFLFSPITLDNAEVFVDLFLTDVYWRDVISGTGNIKIGIRNSTLDFNGTNSNTFRGRLDMFGDVSSVVTFERSAGVVVNDALSIHGSRFDEQLTVRLFQPNQIGDNAAVAITTGAKLLLLDRDETIGSLALTNTRPDSIAETGGATLDMGAATLTLNGGITSWSESGAPLPIIKGRLALPAGNHAFDIGGTTFAGLDMQAEITGLGGFTKSGNAALLLQVSNTFSGPVVVSEGVVEARTSRAFGAGASGVQLNGGSVNLRNVAITTEPLTVTDSSSSLLAFDTCTWAGSITLNRQLTILGDDLHLPGVIVGTGDLVLLGTAIELSGSFPNTFTGATHANCDLLKLNKAPTGTAFAFSGPLLIGQDSFVPKQVRWLNDFQINRSTTPVTLGPQALMNLNGHNDTIGSLTFRGGAVQNAGAATLSLFQSVTANIATATASISGGRLALASGQRGFHVEDGALGPDLSITTTIVDLGGITKTGPGTLLLNAPNSFSGPVAIDAGVVHIQNNTSLGSTGAGTTVADGATLQIEFVGALAELLNIRGAGHGGTLGALNLMAATGIGAGVVLAGPSTVRVDQQFGILSGVISGTGPFTKVGAGSLQFGGGGGAANTYTGDTFVAEGILVTSKATGVTTVPGHLIIGGGGGILGTSATVRHFNGFTIGGSVTVNRGGLWDLAGQSEDFSVPALQGRPPLTLTGGGDVQTGAGTLFLPAGGDVVVNPGTGFGFTSSMSGNLGLDPGQHRFVVGSGPSIIGLDFPELDVSAVISQTSTSADIVKEGPGEMRLSGSNSFAGSVTVNAGLLTAAHSSALGTVVGGTFVHSNASFALSGGITVTDELLTLDSTNTAALLSLGPVTNVWSGNIVLQRTAGIRVADASGALMHSGLPGFGTPAPNISGPGGFTKSGSGALFIGVGGGNSYLGLTTVSDGLLEALRGRSLSSNIVVTGANTVLRTGLTGLPIFAARTVLPAGASVAIETGALWAMNGTNFETISQLVGDGRLIVSTAGALTISNSVSCTFTGQFSGSGALNKYGLATFRVTGNSPGYTGPATVFDGTYKVDGQFLNNPVTVKASSILRGNGAVGDVVVENGGVVRADSDGPGRLGGEFVMNSANFQNGGVLGLAFYGPHPTGGNDSLFVNNAVTLTSPSLSSGFQYAPRDGDVIALVNKSAAGAISGALSGFPEGVLRFIGGVPVVMSYVGGDGNDVTLTVTNLPLRGGGTQLATGKGGTNFVPNDCSQLTLTVTNRGAVALTGLRAQLRSLTEGVTVTRAESAYPNLPPNARGSNATPFQIRTEPTFACSAGVEFELVLTASNQPPFAILYTLLGTSGHGLEFDGRNDQVEIPANTYSGVVNNFTIELWAKPAGNRSVTAETNSGVSGISVPLRQLQRFAVFPDRGNLAYGATHVSAGLSIGRNGISVYEQGTNNALGTLHLPSRLVYSNAVSGWTHVALVYANRAPRLYVNGTLVRSGAATPFPNVNPSGSLGGSPQASYGNFDGQLDEVRIWNVALNQSQIQSNMSRSLAGTEPGLITYFRCDDAAGDTLTDSAPAAPNRNGTLANGATFALPGVTPFGDVDCNSGGGACESCFVVSGRFDTNVLESARRINATGLPSICDPPKPCPDFSETPDAPVRHVLHHFTNTTASELCVTAQLRVDCPGTPPGLIGVAAYLGEFRINQPCSSFLGDDGAFGPPSPPFSFRVPPNTNIVLVVTARDTNLLCDSYSLELFGLPCPPPTLHIARDAAPDKVLLQWSSAYPDFRLQSANSLTSQGPSGFGNAVTRPVLSGGKFAITNATAAPHQFFQLVK